MTAIPYVDLAAQNRAVAADLVEALQAVIEHGRLVLGPEVERIEREIAALHAAPDRPSPWALGVSNGTDALVLALEALGVGPGDEVITVPNTFVSTVAAVVRCRARPVFVDVDEHQLLDPDALSVAFTERTRAVIPVHLHGRPADMTRIMAVADAHAVPVVEDAAQALGAEWAGRPAGSFGVLGCYSMHPLKPLGALGDAGMIVGRSAAHLESLRLLRNHGLRDRDRCEVWGHNARMDTLQAAMLGAKLRRLPEWIERRRNIATRYLAEFAGLPLELPVLRPLERPVWSSFVVETDDRDALRDALAADGVTTLVYYPVPVHLQPAARDLGYGPGSFPVAERHARRMCSLPLHAHLSDDDVRYVVAAVRKFFE